MSPKFKEADMAAPAIAWLEERGFEVHQEVRLYAGGKRADIVGVSGNTTIVIEMKTTLTFAVVPPVTKPRSHGPACH